MNDKDKIKALWKDRDKPLVRSLMRAYMSNIRRDGWVPLDDMPALVAKYWSKRDNPEFSGVLSHYLTMMLADISD